MIVRRIPLLVLLCISTISGEQAANLEDLFRQGVVALADNQLELARTRLEDASKLAPADPRIWLALAQVYLKESDKDLAENAASEVISLAGDDPNFQHGLAIHFAEAGDFARAAEYESRCALQTGDADIALQAAHLYLAAGNAKGAIDIAT